MLKQILIASGVVAVSSLLAAQSASKPAHADLKDANGKAVGTAHFTETPNGVLINFKLMGLPPGDHALHVHATGKCEPPQFTTAGGHFNPTAKMHGFMDAKGPHTGDLPNIHVAADGTAAGDAFVSMATLSGKTNAILDTDGAAIVVHATADDYKTDPAGNAGARIACGVITPM
jgi:Cu-Zn family superoxide dismutase